jgi:hypothetical protein
MAARVKREALTGPLRGLETAMAMAQRYSPEDLPPAPGWDFKWLDDEELDHFHVLLAKVQGEPLDPEQNPINDNTDPEDFSAERPIGCEEEPCDLEDDDDLL